MKNHILFYILIAPFFLVEMSLAQTQQLKFDKITGANGVSIGTINAITQDKYGFIWFSDETNHCITRYDGSSMKRYEYDLKDPHSLGGYYPECFFADSTGILWIGFYGQGLDRFDPMTESFTHFRHDPEDLESLSDDYVSAVRIDHLGNIWVGTNKGLDLLNQVTGKFVHYPHVDNDSTSLSYNEVRAIYEDREGTLWVGTGFQTDDGGLNRFNRNTGTFTRYLHDPKNPQSLINNAVRAIFEDSMGNFWVGTAGDGLHTMDRKTGLFQRHTFGPKRPEKLGRWPSFGEVNIITFIAEDSEGYIWVGSNLNGINRYDPVTKEISHYGNNSDDSGTFIENTSWWIYMAQDGLIWLSTQPGLYRIDPYYIPISRFNQRLNVFYQESSTISWIGTDNGLIREDIKNRTSTKFVHDASRPNSISDNYIKAILMDTEGMLWVGTASGLNKYDPATGLFTQFLHEPDDSTSLTNDDILAIYQDSDSNLWIGTAGGGLVKFDRNSGRFTNFNLTPNNPLGDKWVHVIIEEDLNNFLIGLTNSIYKVNSKNGNSTPYATGFRSNSLYKDDDGINWVGTEQGLFQHNKSTDDFTSIINEGVYSIISDEYNNLWVSSSTGFLKINKSRDRIIHYSKENKVSTGFFRDNVGKGYQKQDGQIFLGEPLGYYAFYPDKLITPTDTSKVYITDLWLNGKPVKPGNDRPLDRSLYEAGEINLDYDQNVFSLNITEIDFRNTQNDVIFYLLENYDEDFRSTNPGEKVNYFKVPPGEYVFRIKAANSSSGLWAEKSITILISPPWWLTWWAYILYGLLFVAGVFLVDRIQRRRLIEKERARTRERELEQAKEIEKAYEELKTTQSQLIHSEKMASLGELTAGIAHEIQNPLNFVNNFSDVNKELVEELREEIKKGNGKEAEAILKDIEENEEKIMHHGKRADGIVKGMLQHSRAGGGEKEPTDINALADEYLRLAYHGLRAKDKSFNADFKIELGPNFPKVNVVPQDIGRVLLNLINNAFFAVSARATGEKDFKPEVVVSTKRVDSPLGERGGTGGVQISIKDNGPGIPEDIKDKIFQPFFTTKSTGEGTGLGLSLSYDIVTKGHGGELLVESKKGQDTEFTVVLPING